MEASIANAVVTRSKKVIVADRTGEPKKEPPKRISPVPENPEDLGPRTKNKILRDLAKEAKKAGRKSMNIWAQVDLLDRKGKRVDVVTVGRLGDALARLREIEQDAIRLGYHPDKFGPIIRGAFLSGLIEGFEHHD